MARKRLTMRKIREVLRLRWQQRRSVRETARALGVSTGVVAKLTHRAKLAGLSWEQVEQLNDDALERLLYGSPAKLGTSRAEPDPVWIDTELRKPGVSLVLLHLEYLQEHPKGFKYTAFCNRYRKWKEKRGITMRQVHKAGEKMFVDYSGKKPSIVDRETGEARTVELFVATLGASSMTYATATLTQQSPDWIAANTNALEFFGGVARITVPDQLRSAISTPSRYEPAIQQTYAKWAQHYGTVVIPARPYKARDKAKVEVAVQVAQRWILAKLRHETFFSLGELNVRIAELVADLNQRPMKKRGGQSRRELFDKLDRPTLQALPRDRFEPCTWCRARVGDDYHVLLADRHYSVPCALVREEVDARITSRLVEIFFHGRRVASHERGAGDFDATTDPAHRPPHHQAWADMNPGGLQAWAHDVGPYTETMMTRMLDASHNFDRQVRWRSARGLRRLADTYPDDRIEAACRRALHFGSKSYLNVKRILEHGLERQPIPDEVPRDDAPIEHEQVRGPEYYQ